MRHGLHDKYAHTVTFI